MLQFSTTFLALDTQHTKREREIERERERERERALKLSDRPRMY